MQFNLEFYPMFDKVLIRRQKEEMITKSGLHIPQTVLHQERQGTVLSVGKGKWVKEKLIPTQVKPNDRVLFPHYVGQYIKINGEELMLLKEEELIARLDD